MIYTEIRPDLNSDYNNHDDHFGSADACWTPASHNLSEELIIQVNSCRRRT